MKDTRYLSRGWLIAVLSLAAVSLVIALAVVTWNSRAETRVPTPEAASIQLDPTTGEPGTIVSVTGSGWQPGETVLVQLVEVESTSTDGIIYGSGVADQNGQIMTSFRYPQNEPWLSKQNAIVLAWGATSGRRAQAVFQVNQPTSVPTVEPTVQPDTPTPVPPTPTSIPPTDTPTPVPPTPTPVPPTPTPVPPTATPVPPTPTPKPPTPTPTPVRITDWQGEYYNNVNLVGIPIVRNDKKVDFSWEFGSPMAAIGADNFSVRWSRRLDFEGAVYRFYVRVDDGARLWIDGQLIIDQWHDSSIQTYVAERNMTQGPHDIRMEMYEHTGLAAASLWWEKITSYPDWKGEYFGNTQLGGTPILTRNDQSIDFDWGAGAPAPGLPADNFGVRWTRRLSFPAGYYRFLVEVDDGARLWVDGQLLIDQWHDGSSRYSGDIYLSEGEHALRMEMYEHTGGAMARMWWEFQKRYPDWKGEYFRNRGLDGEPVFVRNDAKIDFNWGSGAPANVLPVDDFSVRWTRQINFEEGAYRFCARADDGVRVQLDDTKPYIIREWHDGSDTYCNDVYVTAGRHRLTVEYYEHLGRAMIQFGWKKLPPGQVLPESIRHLELGLWAPAPAYAALSSQQEYESFLKQHGIRPINRDGQGTSDLRWGEEVVVVAFLGEKPAAGYKVDVAQITYKDNNVTVHLQITQPRPEDSQPEVVASPSVAVGVKQSALPKGPLKFSFVDQDGKAVGITETSGHWPINKGPQ
jgi:hypothetical protein